MSLKKHIITFLALIPYGQRTLAEENPSEYVYSLGNASWRSSCKSFCSIRVNHKATVKDLFVLQDANIAGTLTTKNLVITGSTTYNGSETINGNIYLRHTTPNPGSIGSIYKEGILFLHDFGPALNNVFLGHNSGNLTLSGEYNTGTGTQTLTSLTSGSANTATGFQALANTTSGLGNAAFGAQSLFFNTEGRENTGVGFAVLANNTT